MVKISYAFNILKITSDVKYSDAFILAAITCSRFTLETEYTLTSG